MPFDDSEHGEHGGGDDRHEDLPETVEAMLQAAVMTAQINGKCVDCCMVNMAVNALARHVFGANIDNKMAAAVMITDLIMEVTAAYSKIVEKYEEAKAGKDQPRPN